MAENEENEVHGPRGNDWEVVSLTASAYAAAPGPELVETTGTENSSSVENKDQASDLLVRSKHFTIPPIPPENLPLEPENLPLDIKSNEIRSVRRGEDDSCQFPSNEGARSETKEPENISIERLAMSNVFPGIQIFDEKGNILAVDGTEFDKGEALQELMNQQDNLSATLASIHSEPSVAESIFEEGYVSTDIIEPSDAENDSGILNSPKCSDKELDGCNLPCGAWWKRRAISLYSHAKDTNTLWSIFIAAAVMGLVILGQRLQLKWRVATDEGIYGRLGQLGRLKQLIVGGQRRGSLIRGGNHGNH